MKTTLTGILIALSGLLLAQTQSEVIDLSGILEEKRDQIASNDFYIQKDGSFQLVTQEHFYKFDAVGKFTGKEDNTIPKIHFNREASDYLMSYKSDWDQIVSYDGEGILSICELNGSGKNNITTISIPPLESLAGINGEASVEYIFPDEDHIVLAFGYAARSTNSHGAGKASKNVISTFLRVVSVEISSKKVSDAYYFIDKCTIPAKGMNNVKVNINDFDNDHIQIGISTDKRDERNVSTLGYQSGR